MKNHINVRKFWLLLLLLNLFLPRTWILIRFLLLNLCNFFLAKDPTNLLPRWILVSRLKSSTIYFKIMLTIPADRFFYPCVKCGTFHPPTQPQVNRELQTQVEFAHKKMYEYHRHLQCFQQIKNLKETHRIHPQVDQLIPPITFLTNCAAVNFTL